MPTGMASLALCLKVWLNGKYDGDVYKGISSSLGFSDEAPLILYPLNRCVSQFIMSENRLVNLNKKKSLYNDFMTSK